MPPASAPWPADVAHTTPEAASAAALDAAARRDIAALWALATVDLRAVVADDMAELGAAGWTASAPAEPGWPTELGDRFLDRLAEAWHGPAPDLQIVDVNRLGDDLVTVTWVEPVPYAVDERGCMVHRMVITTMVRGFDGDGLGWRLAGWNGEVADMSWPPHVDPVTAGWARCAHQGPHR